MYNRNRLIELVRERALQFGQFTLASGKTARYYLDCRKLTLVSEGAVQIGAGVLEALGDPLPAAVGGMAIGADPITGAVITLAGMRDLPLKGFIVRKETKAHGTQRMVEGPVEPGETAVIVEDVVTSGGSSVLAIERAREFGLKVDRVIAIVDREAGGRQRFQQMGVDFTPLLTIRDLGIED